MPTIRKSVYIGLGGTGIKAIANAKKMYEDIFGKDNVPPQIGFVAIDFDKAIVHDQKLPTSIEEDFIQLPDAVNPFQTYATQSKVGMYKWLFPKNSAYLPHSIQDGAAQVRTTGRMLTELIMQSINQKVRQVMDSVQNLSASAIGYSVSADARVDVHIAMSLAGGTGCGSFINVAQYIKETFYNVNIYGYGVLYGVFRAMDANGLETPRVCLNSMSAVMDLDYMQSASLESPVSFTVANMVKSITSPLYDNFFLVDNATERGERVLDVNTLCQALGTCMFLAGGELGDAVNSILCNVGWKQGGYNWENKLGWAQRIGVCQVVYKGEELAKLYTKKVQHELIRQMMAGGPDIAQLATNWTESVGIREDGDEYNQLIDGIYHPDEINRLKMPAISPDDSYQVTDAEVSKYVDNFQNFPKKEAIHTIRQRIVAQLGEKVVDLLKNDGAIQNTMEFLNALSGICAGYKGEMENERMLHNEDAENKQRQLDASMKALKEYLDKARIWQSKQGRQELIDEICPKAKAVIKAKVEARRREEAAEIFAVLINEIGNHIASVDMAKRSLESWKDTLSTQITAAQNDPKASSKLFEYDLSSKERLNMALNQNEVLLTDFLKGLGKSIAQMSKEEIEAAMEAYADTLPRCIEYRTKLIEDVIQGLSQQEYDKLKLEVDRKASPLLKLNDRGLLDPLTNLSPSNKMVKKYLVSIYKEDKEKKSRIELDRNFAPGGFTLGFAPSDTPNMKQRILFYRSDSAVIPYCVESLNETVEHEYQTIINQVAGGHAQFHPHFDLQIYEEMKKQNFKLKPEMKDEGMFYWVAGQIFGWQVLTEKARVMEKTVNGETIKEKGTEEVQNTKYIRYYNKKYYYWNEKSTGHGQLGKWTETPSVNRHNAYEYFKSEVLPQLREVFKAKILADVAEKGAGFYATKIEEIKSFGRQDYIDRLMCANKSSVTFYAAGGNTHETAFVDEEWAYFSEKFKDALTLLK